MDTRMDRATARTGGLRDKEGAHGTRGKPVEASYREELGIGRISRGRMVTRQDRARVARTGGIMDKPGEALIWQEAEAGMRIIKEVTGADLRWNVLTADCQDTLNLIVRIFLGRKGRDRKLTEVELRRFPMPMPGRLSVQLLREFAYARIWFSIQERSQMLTPVREKGDAVKIQYHLPRHHLGRSRDAIRGPEDQLRPWNLRMILKQDHRRDHQPCQFRIRLDQLLQMSGSKFARPRNRSHPGLFACSVER
jgi:hypothetical protein